MNIIELYELYKLHPAVQTDTRKLQKGDIFFALKGLNFNGNSLALEALERGAVYAVIDDASYNTHTNMILVDNVLDTLQQLALYHRNQFDIPVIAITGSNGKTTTKELIHHVLSTTYNTHTTYGNLNNHIGVPLTLLNMREDAEVAVIEMGANHKGEIAGYCGYTRPGYGLITNIGKAHLEGFGGFDGVKKGKGELFEYLRVNEGTAFVMSDSVDLTELSAGIRNIFTYGTANADVNGSRIGKGPFLTVLVDGLTISTKLVGDYNLPNVLAAVAVGKYFKVEDEKIKDALEAYSPDNNRSQLVEKNGNKIILDAYNANPTSMRAAIENFTKIPSRKKILILGGMNELGPESLYEHEQIVRLIRQYEWMEVALVGGDFLKIESEFRKFKNAGEAAAWLQSQAFSDAYLLIKGSRSMKMENVLD